MCVCFVASSENGGLNAQSTCVAQINLLTTVDDKLQQQWLHNSHI